MSSVCRSVSLIAPLVSDVADFSASSSSKADTLTSVKCCYDVKRLYLAADVGFAVDEVWRQVINEDGDDDDGDTGDSQVDSDHRPHLYDVIVNSCSSSTALIMRCVSTAMITL